MKKAGARRGDMLAFEVYKSSGSNKDATREEMSENLYTLINAVKEQLPEVELLIKTNIDTWKNHVAWELYESEFSRINLWVEQWRTSPDYPDTLYPWGKDGWKFWEYSSTGKVAGINGSVLISKSRS
jgi:lysozyme